MLADKLAGYTEKCTISFIDLYRNIKGRVKNLGLQDLSDSKIMEICKALTEIAQSYGCAYEGGDEQIFILMLIRTALENGETAEDRLCALHRAQFDRLAHAQRVGVAVTLHQL